MLDSIRTFHQIYPNRSIIGGEFEIWGFLPETPSIFSEDTAPSTHSLTINQKGSTAKEKDVPPIN